MAARADFHILELDKATLKPDELPYFAEASRAPELVPDADLLVITGTTLLNDTLPGLLELAKPGARIVVTRPTVSMLPDAFFKRGVTALGGILVTRPDELLDIISEGGSGYHFFGKISRDDGHKPQLDVMRKGSSPHLNRTIPNCKTNVFGG